MSGLQKNERDIYIVLDQFLSGEMDPITFENEFHIAFCLEYCINDLSEKEEEIFDDLNDTVQWFNPSDEERAADPGFIDAQTMRAAALVARERLGQLKKNNKVL